MTVYDEALLNLWAQADLVTDNILDIYLYSVYKHSTEYF